MSRVHADIEALKGLHEALSRFRQVMREVADRGDDQVEMARASLEARAGHYRSRLEQCQAELDACRSMGDGGYGRSEGYGRSDGYAGPADGYRADCSGYARAVAEAAERLERIRSWQQRIDQEASEFLGTAGRFRDLLETDLPRTEEHLLAVIASLQAARRVPVSGS